MVSGDAHYAAAKRTGEALSHWLVLSMLRSPLIGPTTRAAEGFRRTNCQTVKANRARSASICAAGYRRGSRWDNEEHQPPRNTEHLKRGRKGEDRRLMVCSAIWDRWLCCRMPDPVRSVARTARARRPAGSAKCRRRMDFRAGFVYIPLHSDNFPPYSVDD